MAEPTREQFDAAVKAVIAGHKEGDAPLSREAFNQQITNEIARANPPERPSTSGFLRNLGDSTINLVTAPVRMVGSALTTDPGKTITNIGAGLRKRAGEYKRDPLGLAYRDPAGVGADLFAGGSILKALPGIYEAGMSGLRKAGGGAEAGESAYTGPKSSVLTGADQFRPNVNYRPITPVRAGGAPHFPEFASLEKAADTGVLHGGDRFRPSEPYQPVAPTGTKGTPHFPDMSTERPPPDSGVLTGGDQFRGGDYRQTAPEADPRTPFETPEFASAPKAAAGRNGPPRLVGPAPTVDDAIHEALQAAMKQDGPSTVTAAPVPGATITPHGNPSTPAPTPAPANIVDEAGRDLGTQTSGAAERPAGPWDSNAAPAPDSAPAEEHFFNSTDPANSDPNWHSGADPGSPEAASAQSVHKELGTMDSDWKRRMMDDKGSINPDLLTGVVLDELLRKLNVPGAIRKVGGAVAGPLVEGGLDLAAGSNDSTGGR